MTSFEMRWDRFVRRLEAGGVVPLAGAGVSQQSACWGDATVGLSVGHLSQQLARLLEDKIDGLTERDATWDTVQELLALDPKEGALKDLDLGQRCERLGKARFDRLAEVATWLTSAQEVVKVCGIDHYHELYTLPAHRYSARLAREGFIREILTTNYDTCFELAYRGTFRHERFHHERSSEVNPAWPAVVRDLNEYRMLGSRREIEDGDSEHVLVIFKLNGCASRLSSHHAWHDILLTESQLRQFGQQWKQELLADRSRSRSLVLTGFGSDEPQVRNVLLDLAAEFARDPQREPQNGTMWHLPNAPFVAVYGTHLSYPQHQLLRAFALAHGAPKHGLASEEWNAFGGGDHTGTLPADDFWRWAYTSVVGNRLLRGLRGGGSIARRLGGLLGARRYVDRSRTAVHLVRRWLVVPLTHREETSTGSAGQRDRVPAPRKGQSYPLAALLDEHPGGKGSDPVNGRTFAKEPSLALQRWLQGACGHPLPPSPLKQHEFYQPIAQKEEPIGLLLLALWGASDAEPIEVPTDHDVWPVRNDMALILDGNVHPTWRSTHVPPKIVVHLPGERGLPSGPLTSTGDEIHVRRPLRATLADLVDARLDSEEGRSLEARLRRRVSARARPLLPDRPTSPFGEPGSPE